MATTKEALQGILAQYDPWERINAASPNKPLTTSEAAIFMTFSLSTLERHRVNGTGPDYFQSNMRHLGNEPAQGPNQHIRYFKADIEAWYQRGKVNNTMESAVRKGQAFTTLMDLAEPSAFYVGKDGNIESLVENTPFQTVLDRVGEWAIIWLPASEAASRRWSSLTSHQVFADSIEKVLDQSKQAIKAGLEATEISESIRH